MEYILARIPEIRRAYRPIRESAPLELGEHIRDYMPLQQPNRVDFSALEIMAFAPGRDGTGPAGNGKQDGSGNGKGNKRGSGKGSKTGGKKGNC